MTLKKWNELPVDVRRSTRKLYNYMRSELTSEESETVTRTIKFTVNDGSNAIEAASVQIGTETKTTGSAGGCSFTIPDGQYAVSVSKDGYTTKTENITVSETNTDFTISLTANAS